MHVLFSQDDHQCASRILPATLSFDPPPPWRIPVWALASRTNTRGCFRVATGSPNVLTAFALEPSYLNSTHRVEVSPLRYIIVMIGLLILGSSTPDRAGGFHVVAEGTESADGVPKISIGYPKEAPSAPFR